MSRGRGHKEATGAGKSGRRTDKSYRRAGKRGGQCQTSRAIKNAGRAQKGAGRRSEGGTRGQAGTADKDSRKGTAKSGKHSGHATAEVARATFTDDQLELFARCASGFEKVLARELKDLGMQRVRPLMGGVAFFGSLRDAYMACLWSRVATRVQLVLARVGATDANALYDGVARIAWENHIPPAATIAVEAHGTNDHLRNTAFSALRVKDAVCDRLVRVRNDRPNVEAKAPDFAINVAIHDLKATVYLNLSGESLHRRGYRKDGEQSVAPLKETLAASVLLAAGWPSMSEAGTLFVDPMCGSGTLAIEAALIASHTAPGLLREHWGFMGWAMHEASLWQEVLAHAKAECLSCEGRPRIIAGDVDAHAVRLTRDNARRAHVEQWIDVRVADAHDLRRRLRGSPSELPGLLATNPPYGVRLLSAASLHQTYDALASAVAALPRGWRVAVITPDAGIDSSLGRVPATTLACRNGALPTWVRVYGTDEPTQTVQVTSLDGTQRIVPVADKNSAQFAGRLRKVARERRRWAQREGVDCYRLYDADLPDYAFFVDLYQEHGSNVTVPHLVIAEHRRPRSADSQRATRHLADAAALAAALLDIKPQNVHVLPWEDELADKRASDDASRVRVLEDGNYYRLDLSHRSHILPLSQRVLRRHVAVKAPGKRVVGLFAGSAALVAAALRGGARSLTIVDASRRHMRLALDSVLVNDSSDAVSCICEDPRVWASKEATSKRTYDLVLCAPPQWLPAKDAGAMEWDLARDHVDLLQSLFQILSRKGTLLFVCQDPQAELHLDKLAQGGIDVRDLSRAMLPDDFARSRNATRVFELRR